MTDWLKGIIMGVYVTFSVMALIIFAVIFCLIILGLIRGDIFR